ASRSCTSWLKCSSGQTSMSRTGRRRYEIDGPRPHAAVLSLISRARVRHLRPVNPLRAATIRCDALHCGGFEVPKWYLKWGPATVSESTQIILVDQIEPLIRTFRGRKVMLDSDLTVLYGVPTKRLNEQVRRNKSRFPEDFMFRLTVDEAAILRSQNATASND